MAYNSYASNASSFPPPSGGGAPAPCPAARLPIFSARNPAAIDLDGNNQGPLLMLEVVGSIGELGAIVEPCDAPLQTTGPWYEYQWELREDDGTTPIVPSSADAVSGGIQNVYIFGCDDVGTRDVRVYVTGTDGAEDFASIGLTVNLGLGNCP